MSPIIYESTDFAVGVTDAMGNLLAQGNGVTGFLATLDTAVQSTLPNWSAERIRPGDVFITNSPYEGGGIHLFDVVIIYPVFGNNELIAWTVNKAHWTEIGGTYPGGYGVPAERDRELLIADLRNGYVTAVQARRDYCFDP